MSKVLFIAACLAIFLAGPTVAQLLPFPPLPGHDIQQCMSAFQSVTGCLTEIFASFFSGQVGQFGPTCCKVITDLSDSCLPKLFPFNPYFPFLLKDSCSKVSGVAPSTAAIPKGTTTKIGEISAELLTVAPAPSET
ncbi:hypothetical protein IFM89_029805 [Coptis chinensis]|uniref:Prolamin-like domain-containing protein n=1 Tax=Coptis chinensis TaxID=261450 RepID=A0A835HMS9_9MAGN|nr:hypothetical protein IFM89_029805 [Coptis chinensis]